MAIKPLVSIITPSYNQVSFLEEAMNSVLSQDYPYLEYWIIDGGSSDGSLDIIQDYAHKLDGWISEPDRGQGDAINKGLQRAKGDILAWLNSDDLYRPGAIKSAVALFEKFPHVGLIYSDVDSIDEKGVIFNRMTYGQWGLQDLMAFKIIGQPSVFFRRSALEKAGYLEPSYHYLLDHHLWLRIALDSQLKYLPGQVLAAARIHPGAKNVTDPEKFGEEASRLVNWMAGDPQYKSYFKDHQNQIWAGAHRLNAFYLLDGGKPGEALKAYWRGLLKHPQTVLKDWRRIAFALLSPFKIQGLRDRFLEKRKKRFEGERTK